MKPFTHDRFISLPLVLALALGGASAFFQGCSSGEEAPAGVSKLVLQVQSKGYIRDIDSHKFSLFYRAKAPNTIVFVVRTKPDADLNEVRMVITSAKDMIRQEAKSLNLPEPNIEVDQAPLKK
jgi:hypothetical protein